MKSPIRIEPNSACTEQMKDYDWLVTTQTSTIERHNQRVIVVEQWIIRSKLGEFSSFPLFVQTVPTNSDGWTFLQHQK